MSDDHQVVLLDTDVAEELLDLVRDEPGDADERRLTEAVEALRHANGGLSGPEQQRVAVGEAIAFGITPTEKDVVETLIVDNEEQDTKALVTVGNTLKSKLRTAGKKASRGPNGNRRSRRPRR